MSERLFNGEPKFMNFTGAADYISTGAIHVPVFERQIMDRTKKRGTLLQRIQTKAATGHPTRYFEKEAHTSKHSWIDPRAIDHALNTEITRVERSAYIKALVDGITFTLFDYEVTQQQGLFGNLQAQDLAEVVTDMLDAQDRAVWTGTADSLMDSTKKDYCSLITQITKTGTILSGVRLTTAIIEAVAALMYNKQYKVTPTAIYMNPLDKAELDTQEMEAKDKVKTYDVEILPGIVINGIMTSAGILPIITDIYCPKGKIAILDESLIERQYVTSATPRLYQIGGGEDIKNQKHDLATRYIAILFDTFIVRAPSYGHMILTIAGSSGDALTSKYVGVDSTTTSASTTITIGGGSSTV
ncbi:MAG: hypothetical protein IJ668_04545 [Selenomonadaceae bacterium]|nr:hypothetical protein [Selenomonadaceae bacterium]